MAISQVHAEAEPLEITVSLQIRLQRFLAASGNSAMIHLTQKGNFLERQRVQTVHLVQL